MNDEPLTTVDFWAFRSKSSTSDLKNLVGAIYRHQAGLKVDFISTGSGWQGYAHKDLITANGANLGIIAHGGKHQRGWSYVGISGTGCEWLGDVDQAHREVSQVDSYSLRRVDIALTLMDGSVGHESVLSAYETGGFKAGVRPPKFSQILPGDPREGRTIYIGSRERDKFFRAYEKGFELLRGAPENLRQTLKEIDGVPVEDIYRLELELKPKTCPLPVDLIESRDQYFSGAYPYLQQVLHVEPRVMEIRRDVGPQLNLEAALANIQQQYGPTLFTALTAYEGDVCRLMSKIMGNRHNAALVEAGVLLADHG